MGQPRTPIRHIGQRRITVDTSAHLAILSVRQGQGREAG